MWIFCPKENDRIRPSTVPTPSLPRTPSHFEEGTTSTSITHCVEIVNLLCPLSDMCVVVFFSNPLQVTHALGTELYATLADLNMRLDVNTGLGLNPSVT